MESARTGPSRADSITRRVMSGLFATELLVHLLRILRGHLDRVEDDLPRRKLAVQDPDGPVDRFLPTGWVDVGHVDAPVDDGAEAAVRCREPVNTDDEHAVHIHAEV